MTPQQIVTAILGSGWTFQRGFSLNGDPITGNAGHYGWDISTKKGTPIPSLRDGTVVVTGSAGATGIIPGHPQQGGSYDVLASGLYPWLKGGGNIVVINSGGINYVYAHLDKISVKAGDKISAGQLIGTVGDTGDATGPHLHFGMIDWTKKQWVDPSSFLTQLVTDRISFNLLGAFGNIVAFPTGHQLTEQDVNDIMAKLDTAKFFDANSGVLLLGPFIDFTATSQARDKTRSILMGYVGQSWTPDLQKQIQNQFFGTAKDAVTNPVQSLADIAGKLVDPTTYIHTGAFLIGVVLLFIGFRWIVQGSEGALGFYEPGKGWTKTDPLA